MFMSYSFDSVSILVGFLLGGLESKIEQHEKLSALNQARIMFDPDFKKLAFRFGLFPTTWIT